MFGLSLILENGRILGILEDTRTLTSSILDWTLRKQA